MNPLILLLGLLALLVGNDAEAEEHEWPVIPIKFMEYADTPADWVAWIEADFRLEPWAVLPDLSEHGNLGDFVSSDEYRRLRAALPKWRELPPRLQRDQSLTTARSGFETQLRESSRVRSEGPPPLPPGVRLERVKYSSPAGELWAYRTPTPSGEVRRPAIVWCHRDIDGLGSDLWRTPELLSSFEKHGLTVFFPSWRGEHDNPGRYELLYGEVDDALAAVEAVAALPGVDPTRVYVGGHGIGGSIALLVGQSQPRIGGEHPLRGVFALSPPLDLLKIFQQEAEWAAPPFDVMIKDESYYRSPGMFLDALDVPTLLVATADFRNRNLFGLEVPMLRSFSVNCRHERVIGVAVPPIARWIAGDRFAKLTDDEVSDVLYARRRYRDDQERARAIGTEIASSGMPHIERSLENAEQLTLDELALALQIVLLSGHTHRNGEHHHVREAVGRSLEHLEKIQNEDGTFGDQPAHSLVHARLTLSIAEILFISRDRFGPIPGQVRRAGQALIASLGSEPAELVEQLAALRALRTCRTSRFLGDEVDIGQGFRTVEQRLEWCRSTPVSRLAGVYLETYGKRSRRMTKAGRIELRRATQGTEPGALPFQLLGHYIDVAWALEDYLGVVSAIERVAEGQRDDGSYAKTEDESSFVRTAHAVLAAGKMRWGLFKPRREFHPR